MSDSYVAVYAMKIIFMLFVVKMSFPAFPCKPQRIIILMAMYAGSYITVFSCLFNLRFGFPVEAFRIPEPLSPKIPKTGPDFGHQITISMGRKMAIYTMDMNPHLVIVMG
jgi:hypothetical protein